MGSRYISNASPISGSVRFDLTSAVGGRTYHIFAFRPFAPPPPIGRAQDFAP
jgi:hypothetical protein